MSRAVIFDLDGTLVDSAPDIHAAANRVMRRHGLAPFTLEEARSFVGHGAAVFIERCLVARGVVDHPGLKARALGDFLEIYERAVNLTRPYPGAVAALETLAAQGLRLGLCTNKPEGPARALLRHLGLEAPFEVLIGGDSLPVRKPDPAPLRAAIAGLGAARVVYVGDSEVDAETSRRAEVPFALFTEGYRKSPLEALPHAASFDEFSALPDIALRLLE